jgi:hypothetical protein
MSDNRRKRSEANVGWPGKRLKGSPEEGTLHQSKYPTASTKDNDHPR